MFGNFLSAVFTCNCRKPPFHFSDFAVLELGEDLNRASISVETCKKCGTKWLKYLIEEPHHTGSGRWWRVSLEAADITEIDIGNARRYIEQNPWCFVGGSFFRSAGVKKTAPIVIK